VSDSVSVDREFINKIDTAVKEIKSSTCNMVEFLNILLPYLSVSGCKQLFDLYEQVLQLQRRL